MNISYALDKLNTVLPLVERQRKLSFEEQKCHRNILSEFSKSGRVPDTVPLTILKKLYKNDLIVLDNSNKIIGAYPFSLRKTDHHIFNENIDLYAMCAFDAVAIAPLFLIKLNIVSQCYVTKETIEIGQDSEQVISVKPSREIYVGIRWQSAGSCSADSLCLEMIFLKDKNIANVWKGDDKDRSIFSLTDAIDFSVSYFKPLLQG